MASKEIERKMRDLALKADQAEEQRTRVVAREPFTKRLLSELLAIRENNHVTQLYLDTVGAQRWDVS